MTSYTSKLDSLLNEVIHSDVSLQRDDLHDRIVSCIPTKIDFFVIIVEKRRFELSTRDIDSERLFLPYLSFGYSKGQKQTFSSPESVKNFTQQARIADLQILWNRPKSIAYAEKESVKYKNIISRVEKIILAYYYACGHYDHFMSNASRRFVQNFLRHERILTLNAVMDAVASNAKCSAIYLRYSENLQNFQVMYDKSDILSKLQGCPQFEDNMSRALKKRGTFSGRSTNNFNYVINVALLDRSYGTFAELEKILPATTNYIDQKRHVLVLASRDPITMDAIKFGPHLFTAHLANDAFSAREKLIFEIYRKTADIERKFVEEPPQSIDDLLAIIHSQFDRISQSASRITAADAIVIRIHDPFTHKLKVVTATFRGEKKVSISKSPVETNSSSVISEVFLTGKSAKVNEVISSSLDLDQEYLPSGRTFGLIFPIRVGLLTRGTVECYSLRPAELQFDEEYLSSIAICLGDVARRLEVASDVAWLSRLSFLHSARHELENFLVLLKSNNKRLFDSLKNILDRYSGLYPSPWALEEQTLTKRVANLLSEAEDSMERRNFLDQMEMVEETFSPDDGFRFIFSEVMSNLVSNAKRHSTLRAGDFVLNFSIHTDQDLGISLKYRCKDKRINVETAKLVSLSPIPDTLTASFHYGLFLAAAQVRMNGGAAHIRRDFQPELDTIPFEVNFTLPFYPLSSTDDA